MKRADKMFFFGTIEIAEKLIDLCLGKTDKGDPQL